MQYCFYVSFFVASILFICDFLALFSLDAMGTNSRKTITIYEVNPSPHSESVRKNSFGCSYKSQLGPPIEKLAKFYLAADTVDTGRNFLYTSIYKCTYSVYMVSRSRVIHLESQALLAWRQPTQL